MKFGRQTKVTKDNPVGDSWIKIEGIFKQIQVGKICFNSE